MKKQSLPILLILMMLMPIVSAFEHCAVMDMPAHVPASQNFSSAQSFDNANSLEHQKMLNSAQHHKMDMDCHSSGVCTLHGCGIYAISTSAPILNIVTASDYSIFEYTSPYSAVLTSDLRPPRSIL